MKLFIKLNVILLILINFNSPAYAGNAISKYFAGVKSFKVSFIQKSIDMESTDSRISHGNLIVKSPDKFYLEYTKPYNLVYVADGKKLWSYDEDLEQVIVKSQKNILINTPAMILSHPQEIDKKYDIESLGTEAAVVQYKLTPKKKDSSFQYIVIGFEKGDLKLMEMIDNFGQHTQLKFNKIEKNPKLNSKTFKFVPPEGVDVITDDATS